MSCVIALLPSLYRLGLYEESSKTLVENIYEVALNNNWVSASSRLLSKLINLSFGKNIWYVCSFYSLQIFWFKIFLFYFQDI